MHRGIWTRLLAVFIAVLIGTSLVLPPRAEAANIACGANITQSITLDADLICTTYGINIAADNITLDLGGHTLTSAGAAGPGVFVGDGSNPANVRSGTTVRNGSIVGFDEGVRLQHAEGSTVVNVRLVNGGPGAAIVIHLDSNNNTVQGCIIENARAGIGITDSSDGNTIRGCSIAGQIGTGILIAGAPIGAPSSNNVIVGNVLHNSRANFSPAISVTGGSNNQIVDNDISSNGCATDAACASSCELTPFPLPLPTPPIPVPAPANTCGSGAHAVFISGGSQTVVQGNTIQANRGEGISIFAATQTQMTNNVITGNGTAFRRSGNLWVGANGVLLVGSTSSPMTGNTVSANGGHGILLASNGPVGANDNTITNNQINDNGRVGISLNSASGNSIEDNHIADGGTPDANPADDSSSGIFIGLGTGGPASMGNTARGNVIVGNAGHGIQLTSGSTLNTIEGNQISGNTRVGVTINASGGNSFIANLVQANDTGIFVGAGSNANVVSGNSAIQNRTFGIHTAALAVGSIQPENNVIEDNIAYGNGTAPPIGQLPFDVRDATTGAGTAGTRNTYTTNYCLLGSPAALCVPQPSTVTTTSTPTGANAPLGASATDVATVTGGGPTPTGTVKFFLCQPAQVTGGGCEGSTGAQVGAPAAGETLAAGIATSDATTNTTTTGKYCWRAEYSGDQFYLPSSHTNATTECFTAAATVQTLTALVNSFVIDDSITMNANALLAKLAAAQAALDHGNSNTAANQLRAFINQVNAQRGNGISAAAADLLIQQAGYVIAALP